MTANKIFEAISKKYSEDGVRERIDEAMYDYVDSDTVEEEYDGDVYECYMETGRGEAESQVLTAILAPYKEQVSSDIYCEVWDKLEEEWSISTD